MLINITIIDILRIKWNSLIFLSKIYYDAKLIWKTRNCLSDMLKIYKKVFIVKTTLLIIIRMKIIHNLFIFLLLL